MFLRQTIRYPSKLQRRECVERRGVENDEAIPARPHWCRKVFLEGEPGGGGGEEGPEVREHGSAASVAHGEGVVESTGFGEIKGAHCAVGAIAGCEERCKLVRLQ